MILPPEELSAAVFGSDIVKDLEVVESFNFNDTGSPKAINKATRPFLRIYHCRSCSDRSSIVKDRCFTLTGILPKRSRIDTLVPCSLQSRP